MLARSLLALLAATVLIAATVPAAEAGQMGGTKRLISVSQTKANDANDCATQGRDCNPPPSKPRNATKKKAGSLFNAAGKDMVYCLPPTC